MIIEKIRIGYDISWMKNGDASFIINAGKIFANNTNDFGRFGPTRSTAADNITT